VATPELNAMEGLWADAKDQVFANHTASTIDISADQFCKYLVDLTPQQRLVKAGVHSGNFWLST